MAARIRTPSIDPVAEYLAAVSSYLSFPTLSVGVIRRGEPPRVFGVPAGAEERAYKVGSLTKLVTALAVMALREDGALQLDDPVERHIGWFGACREDAEPVTIVDLLRHSAGLPRGGLFLSNPTAAEVQAALCRAGPARRMEAAHYSNLGYVLLGLVIEAVTGEAYADFVGQRILAPLGMRDSGFGAGGPGAELTPPHCLSCFQPESTSPFDHRAMRLLDAPHASHDLVSTVADFAAPLALLLEGGREGVIGRDSVETLLGTSLPSADGVRTGPGFRFVQGARGGVWFENGEHFGHSASMLMIPSRGFGLVAMTNRGSAGPDLAHVLNTLTAYYLDGGDPARLHHDYPGAAALAGDYASAEGMRLALTLHDATLFAAVDGEPPSPLVYKGQRCFVKPHGRLARYGMRIDPRPGADAGLCVGPHYFARGGGGAAAREAPHARLAGVYASATAGRVALFGRDGRLVLAFAPFKEAELEPAGPAELVQTTGPFRGETVRVLGDDSIRIGSLTFSRIAASW